MLVMILIIVACVILLYTLRNNQPIGNNVAGSNLAAVEVGNEITEEDDTKEPEELVDASCYDAGEGTMQLAYTQSRNYYFTVEAIIQQYINAIAQKDTNKLMPMIAEEYITKYSLTQETLLERLEKVATNQNTQQINYTVNEMLEAIQTDDTKSVFFVKGEYRANNAATYQEITNIVELDLMNNVYTIYPENYVKELGYNNLKVGDKLDFTNKVIAQKQGNAITLIEKDDKAYTEALLKDWVERTLYKRQTAYDRLNAEYKNKRFSAYNAFDSYISGLRYLPTMNEFTVDNTSMEYTDYICTDQYGAYYVFRVQGGIMRYTTFLDAYTVEIKSLKNIYDKATEENKIAIQLGKIKQMLNNKDYQAMYSKLMPNFKNTNYSNVNKLAEYLKQNTYAINAISLNDMEKNGDYYACTCLLHNQRDSNERKEMKVMMKLIDYSNFQMTFTMQ